jgi:hypothetical protein
VRIRIVGGLPFVAATVEFAGRTAEFASVLVDTGSAGTVFSADRLLDVGVALEAKDEIRRIRGIGGSEFVFTKRMARLAIGTLSAADFVVEVGALDYGFEIDGILGLDFLRATRAIVDLGSLEIRPK